MTFAITYVGSRLRRSHNGNPNRRRNLQITLSDIEIINFNETRLTQKPDITLKMPGIHSIYCGILQENGE